MPCVPFISADGKSSGIACFRGRGAKPKKCATCSAMLATLECDGCDAKLCPACAVSPAPNVDLCPSCAKPAFDWWKKSEGGYLIYADKGRAVGRVAFRAWIRANSHHFVELLTPTVRVKIDEALSKAPAKPYPGLGAALGGGLAKPEHVD